MHCSYLWFLWDLKPVSPTQHSCLIRPSAGRCAGSPSSTLRELCVPFKMQAVRRSACCKVTGDWKRSPKWIHLQQWPDFQSQWREVGLNFIVESETKHSESVLSYISQHLKCNYNSVILRTSKESHWLFFQCSLLIKLGDSVSSFTLVLSLLSLQVPSWLLLVSVCRILIGWWLCLWFK